jgi:hypothetical protein
MTASSDNSFPNEGRAIFTEELMKGKRKDAIAATRSTTALLVPLSTGSAMTSQFSLFTEKFSSLGQQPNLQDESCFGHNIAVNF